MAAPDILEPTPLQCDEDLSVTDRIRQRAHERYMERGAMNGFELEDWLKAESEISQIDRLLETKPSVGFRH